MKNQSKLNDDNPRRPFYVKIVNEDFKETKEKIIDPDKQASLDKAKEVAEAIVTTPRVEKALYKLRDEGVLPSQLTPKDMKTVAKVLPKFIFDDCLKEEPELVSSAGASFGSVCSKRCMALARDIILGQ